MSEVAGTGATARLDELAAVTKKYAKYSRTAFGGANVAAGVWLLAAAAIRWTVSDRAGEVLTFVAPLVWMAMLVSARAYYQRHGEVVQPDPDLSPFPARALALSFIYLVSVKGVWAEFARPRRGFELIVLAALVATPAIAVRVTRGIRDAATAMMVSILCISALRHSDAVSRWFSIINPVAFILLGVLEHGIYRRIERRLTALKETA